MRLSALLLIVGGLNWGSVGVLGKDLVAGLLGARSLGARAVYVAVGLAALFVGARLFGFVEGFADAAVDCKDPANAEKPECKAAHKA